MNSLIEIESTYKGFDYFVILRSGGYRCAYVNVKNTKYTYVDYMNLMNIDCHGGLTFSGSEVNGHAANDHDWWIGWDYAHYGDGYDFEAAKSKLGDTYSFYHNTSNYGHIYTAAEAEVECRNVIEQLIREEI